MNWLVVCWGSIQSFQKSHGYLHYRQMVNHRHGKTLTLLVVKVLMDLLIAQD